MAIAATAFLYGRGRFLNLTRYCNRFYYVRSTLTFSLPEEINRGLASLVKRSGKSRSQVVQEALQRQIAIERFRDLRERIAPKGRDAGFYTDEDVIETVS